MRGFLQAACDKDTSPEAMSFGGRVPAETTVSGPKAVREVSCHEAFIRTLCGIDRWPQ